jgi:hypothetical protein
VEYHLSQRAPHITEELSGGTVAGRPIINTRDEPHADASRFRRLHVIVGDSNMSEMATYLKVGATTLVLDMIEDGFLLEAVRLQSSVTALRAISSDPTLTCRVPLRNGRWYTALELQLSYLDASEEYVRRGGGDPRAEAVLGVDDLVQNVVSTLKQQGELKNTVLMFTSDNGFFHGEHRVPQGKVRLYEPSIRVPLLIRGPGVPKGVHRRQPVGNVDLTIEPAHLEDAFLEFYKEGDR